MATTASELTLAPMDVLKSENDKYHTFINLGMILAVLTGIEIVVIFFPWNEALILWGLIILSVIKFIAVIAWFMHLIYDKAVLTVLFMSGFVIATGTVIALVALFSYTGDEYDIEAMNESVFEVPVAPPLPEGAKAGHH
ncbi:MAG: cytochrome C oxidase subunit IV family protein [Opitutales bacterium]|nr:cytochrome C oxidase subunit IV family protein [Opitutales bacterium]NRA25646.1 cytochrome C oxidase subunit IV family protein [Opitutales bacterium]